MSEKREYRKYANRRFYDTAGHVYCNLSHIAAEVENGGDVYCYRHDDKQDITAEVLLQILVERQLRSVEPLVSLESLHDMVRATRREPHEPVQ